MPETIFSFIPRPYVWACTGTYNMVYWCLPVFFTCLFACQQPEAKKQDVINQVSTADSNWMILPFEKADSVNPILHTGHGTFICPVRKQRVKWEEKDVFNPAAIIKDGKVFLLYRAEDSVGKYAGTSRIGLAESVDGLHFTRHPEPVLFPAPDEQKKYEWEGGCEDPRVVQDSSGTYIMTYYSLRWTNRPANGGFVKKFIALDQIWACICQSL
jgi:beta-1,2-mannosidase